MARALNKTSEQQQAPQRAGREQPLAHTGGTGSTGAVGPFTGILDLQRAAGNRAVSQSLAGDGLPADDGSPENGGHSLDPATRQAMETRFAHDFREVRLHTGRQAAEAAQARDARAYTVGHDIVMGTGQYAPGTPQGDRLLAHELAHVVQQDRGGSGEAVEQRAWDAAAAVVAGQSVSPTTVGGAPPGTYAAGNNDSALGGGLLGAKRPALAALPGLALTVWTFDDFDLNKADLQPKHTAAMNTVAMTLMSMLVKSPHSKVVITGHTDTTGEEAYNETLGTQRALHVSGALLAKGILPQQIEIASTGEHDLAVATPNNTKEPKNRRVTVAVQGPPIEYRPSFPPTSTDQSKPDPSKGQPDGKQSAAQKQAGTKEADDDEGPVEVKIVTVPVEVGTEKKGDQKTTTTTQKVTLEVTLHINKPAKVPAGPVTISFGQIDIQAALGLGAERKSGEKLAIKPVGELAPSITIVEIKVKDRLQLPIISALPKNTKLTISAELNIDLVEGSMKPKLKAELEIPLSKSVAIKPYIEAVPGGGTVGIEGNFDITDLFKKNKK